jgi:exosortase/archaeosortase family protein
MVLKRSSKVAKDIWDMIIRYLIIVLSAFPNLFIFYFIFTPLTIYPIYLILSVFFDVLLIDSILVFNEHSVEIISACVAGSAYYLLFALNLATPKIQLQKRAKALAFSFVSLLVFNILRILILILVLPLGGSLFDVVHKVFWYGMNILVVVAIWFAEVRIFNIKTIPVYSDLKFLYKKSLFKSKRKSK